MEQNTTDKTPTTKTTVTKDQQRYRYLPAKFYFQKQTEENLHMKRLSTEI